MNPDGQLLNRYYYYQISRAHLRMNPRIGTVQFLVHFTLSNLFKSGPCICRELSSRMRLSRLLFTFNHLNVTFFTVGSRALEYPQLLIEEYMAGHEISVHTWSHPVSYSMFCFEVLEGLLTITVVQ